MTYKKFTQTSKVILGIDPGTTRIGYGVIKKVGSRAELMDYGVIEPGKSALRFKNMERDLSSIIKKYKPRLAAVEKIYFSKNKKTAISVAESRGIIMFILNKHNIKTLEFTPNEVKSTVAGSGASDKRTVARYVCLTLGVEKITGPDDAADALAIALLASFQRGS